MIVLHLVYYQVICFVLFALYTSLRLAVSLLKVTVMHTPSSVHAYCCPIVAHSRGSVLFIAPQYDTQKVNESADALEARREGENSRCRGAAWRIYSGCSREK